MNSQATSSPFRVGANISRLPAVREQARLTQMHLASLAGVSERAVRNHETLMRTGTLWEETQKRLLRVCVQEIERQNRAVELSMPP